MARTFVSDVSLHSWLIWPMVRPGYLAGVYYALHDSYYHVQSMPRLPCCLEHIDLKNYIFYQYCGLACLFCFIWRAGVALRMFFRDAECLDYSAQPRRTSKD